ncbi:hypothetical protein GGF37_002745, partial [Kickxella alabastrina]
MDRDSEVETVLADDDWLNTSTDNAHGRRSRRQHQPATERETFESFNEEELFSPSGSLSSLHEFSENDSDSATSENSARSNNDCDRSGPIIRNGLTNSVRDRLGSNGSAHAVDAAVSSAIHTESEVDVDGDDGRGAAYLGNVRKPSTLREASPLLSLSTWQMHRGRKVIADDDDDEDEVGD